MPSCKRLLAQITLVTLLLTGSRFFLPGLTIQAQVPAYRAFRLAEADGLSSLRVFPLLMDQRGFLWVGTFGGGLYRYDGKTFRRFLNHPNDSTSLSGELILSLLEDREGNIWVGTEGAGVSVYDPYTETFTRYAHDPNDPHSLASNRVESFYQDAEGMIWVGLEGSIDRFDPVTGRFSHYSFPDGTFNVWNILEDRRDPNLLWTTCRGGLYRLDKEAETITRIWQDVYPDWDQQLGDVAAYRGIYQEESGRIWLGGYSKGLSSYDPQEQSWTFYLDRENHPFMRFKPEFNAIVSDLPFREYLSDTGYDRNKLWKRLGNSPPVMITDILPKSEEELWLACYLLYGVYVYNITTNTFSLAPRDSSIVQTDLTPFGRKITTDPYGRLWIGGYMEDPKYKDGGVFCLDPVEPAKLSAPLVFSRLTVNDQEFDRGVSLDEKEAIPLEAGQNFFSIHFTFLNYSEPDSNRYEYRLEGLDRDWQRTTQTNNFASYTSVPPGQYTFRVRATHPRGFYSEQERSLRIIINPPWYWTWPAIILWVALLTCLGLAGYLLLRHQWRLQLEMQLKAAEAEQQKRLNEAQSRFYTNITHEFRTPLTIIKGITGQFKGPGNEEHQELIQRNADQLLELINQLLDLARVTSKSLPVYLVQGDIIPFLKYITESFHPLALSRQIKLSFDGGNEAVVMDYDKEKIRQILSNLVSNALKFTPAQGSVQVRVQRLKNELEITVKDTGIGIRTEEQEYIFDRFRQVNSTARQDGRITGGGTGIGLALVRELIVLLQGRVMVHSEPGQGAVFSVFLPIRQEAPVEQAVVPEVSSPSPPRDLPSTPDFEKTANNKAIVLLVEDHPDIIYYLKQLLSARYDIRVASDGDAGIEQALESIPDIIISDIMMPRKDGYELCRSLKKDERTSHIPIILLTAKGDQESRVSGLQCGADAFLVKPFDERELLIRLEKLLGLRALLQAKYQQLEIGSLPARAEQTDPELQFLSRLEVVIREHLADEGFRVNPGLCQNMHMSRPQLYRKIKALKGISPSDYLRQMRIRSAQELLLHGGLTVAEVAQQVGFKDPSHFTKVFHSITGQLPSEMRTP